VNRLGDRADYSWPRVIPKTTHLLHKVACTRTRTTAHLLPYDPVRPPLPAAAIRVFATAVDVAPHAVGMTRGGV